MLDIENGELKYSKANIALKEMLNVVSCTHLTQEDNHLQLESLQALQHWEMLICIQATSAELHPSCWAC